MNYAEKITSAQMHRNSCPKYDFTRQPFPTFYPSRPCWVCEARNRDRYAEWMPYLDELYHWMDNGDVSEDCNQMLYEHFMEGMPYGFQTGDTGTIEEWLCDRPEYVRDLIGDIEYACIAEVAA